MDLTHRRHPIAARCSSEEDDSHAAINVAVNIFVYYNAVIQGYNTCLAKVLKPVVKLFTIRAKCRYLFKE